MEEEVDESLPEKKKNISADREVVDPPREASQHRDVEASREISTSRDISAPRDVAASRGISERRDVDLRRHEVPNRSRQDFR